MTPEQGPEVARSGGDSLASALWAVPVLAVVAWFLWPDQLAGFAVGVGWVRGDDSSGLAVTYLAFVEAAAALLAVGAAVWAARRYRQCRRWLATLEGPIPAPPSWSLVVATAAVAGVGFLLVGWRLPWALVPAACVAGGVVCGLAGPAEQAAARLRSRMLFVRLIRPLVGWTANPGAVRLKGWSRPAAGRGVPQPRRIVIGVGRGFSESTPPHRFSRAANEAGWPGRYRFSLDRAAAELRGERTK